MEYLRRFNVMLLTGLVTIFAIGAFVAILMALGVEDFNLDGSEVYMFGTLSGLAIMAFFSIYWALPVLIVGQVIEWGVFLVRRQLGTQGPRPSRGRRWKIGSILGVSLGLIWLVVLLGSQILS